MKLYNAVEEVLNDNSKAQELLPPSEGFFFGPKDIGPHYFEDLKYTRDKLRDLFDGIETVKNLSYMTYRSSW